MHTDLWPASTYDVLAAKSSWIPTHLNHSCSGPANYHMVFGPCIQTLTNTAAILKLNWTSHCKEKLMNLNVQANWVYDLGRILSRSSNLQLNNSRLGLPWGLYGVAVDCSTPYILQR